MALDNRRGTTSNGEVAINIQNNVEAGRSGVQISDGQPIPGTQGNPTEAKERLTQVLNVMNNLGLMKEPIEGEIIEVETND